MVYLAIFVGLIAAGLPTPAFELRRAHEHPTLTPPVVVKPNADGSSIDLRICRDQATLDAAWAELSGRNPVLLVEEFIKGREVTVGVLGQRGQEVALPPIHIVPATEFYDYEAKYTRDDTRYLFDLDAEPALLDQVTAAALAAHRTLGCRHLSRVDFLVDPAGRPFILELNTLPGFTTHSLLPMAAAKAGVPMPQLVTTLVTWAAADHRLAEQAA